jgi:hypothetical protein
METTKDPCSAILYLMNSITIPNPRSKTPPPMFESKFETSAVDDTRSEFQKALAAAQVA